MRCLGTFIIKSKFVKQYLSLAQMTDLCQPQAQIAKLFSLMKKLDECPLSKNNSNAKINPIVPTPQLLPVNICNPVYTNTPQPQVIYNGPVSLLTHHHYHSHYNMPLHSFKPQNPTPQFYLPLTVNHNETRSYHPWMKRPAMNIGLHPFSKKIAKSDPRNDLKTLIRISTEQIALETPSSKASSDCSSPKSATFNCTFHQCLKSFK